jgi:hypothetical protein
VLDRFDTDFASYARNVRFGLVTDGFDPFSTNSTPYSYLPIFVVPYNVPPSLCMKFEFVFLCLIIPGLEVPGPRINVMLKPLIEELKQLWIGVEAYDCYKKQKFIVREVYLWSINDFKAYDMWFRHILFLSDSRARSSTSIVKDASCPGSISSDKSRTYSRMTILLQRDHRSVYGAHKLLICWIN